MFFLQEKHGDQWFDVQTFADRNEALRLIRDETRAAWESYKASNFQTRVDLPRKRVTAAPGLNDEPLDRLGQPLYVGDRVAAAVGSSSTKPSLIVGTIDSFKTGTKWSTSVVSVKIHIEDAEARGERRFTTLELSESRIIKL